MPLATFAYAGIKSAKQQASSASAAIPRPKRNLREGSHADENKACTRVSLHTGFTDSMSHRSTESDSRNGLHHIVEHFGFQLFINLMIGINVIQMGLATDNTGGNWSQLWWIADNVFTSVFLAEMLLKLAAYRHVYFYDNWNLFDAAIVILSVIDTWIISAFVQGEENTNFSPIRMFRMLRLLRLVKLFRMIPTLMMVVSGLFASLKSVFWVFCLLSLTLYMFAIVCVQVIGSQDAGYPGYNPDETLIRGQYSRFNNHLHFGSLPRAIVSLTNMVLLAEWPTIVWPVWEHQGPAVLIFVALVLLTSFGIMNVIIGVIVERTNEAMAAMKADEIEQKHEQQMQTVEQLVDMILELDEDNSGDLCIDEMKEASRSEQFMKLLGQVDLPKGFTFEDVHHMLDKDADGVVTKEEFVDAMFRIVHGNDFQHQCMLHVNFGEIKLLLHAIHANQEAEKAKQKEADTERIIEERIIQAVKAEISKTSATVLDQLRIVQDQMAEIASIASRSNQLLQAPAHPPSQPSSMDPAINKMMASKEIKEGKAPISYSGPQGFMPMSCSSISRCASTLQHIGHTDPPQTLPEVTQKEISQAPIDVAALNTQLAEEKRKPGGVQRENGISSVPPAQIHSSQIHNAVETPPAVAFIEAERVSHHNLRTTVDSAYAEMLK